MMKTLKVFIVEKDEMTVEIIKGYLQETGYVYTLEVAQNLEDIVPLLDLSALNLCIVDVTDNEDVSIAQMDSIESDHPNCKFVVTAYNLKTDYIVKFLRKSKKDFIDKPIAKTRFISVIKEIVDKKLSEQDFSGQGKIISVFSNKGGLGKTTVAVNLAWELGNTCPSEKVAIVDMNMFLGDVTTFLDTTPPYDMNFIIEKLEQVEDITELATRYGNSNLYIIADSPYREIATNISKEDVLKLFNVLRKKFKYIVVDNSSAMTVKTKNTLDLSDLILLVTEANLPTLRNCKRTLDFFGRIGLKEKTQIVLNRFSYDDDCKTEDVVNVLNTGIFAKLPNDWLTAMESVNGGLTFGECAPDTDINDAYIEFAQMVVKKLCR